MDLNTMEYYAVEEKNPAYMEIMVGPAYIVTGNKMLRRLIWSTLWGHTGWPPISLWTKERTNINDLRTEGI